MKKSFYKLEGNNGAVYIFNNSSREAISRSLDFYKARSLKANVLKKGLSYYLYLTGKYQFKMLNSREEIVYYLNANSSLDFDTYVCSNSSILISPTRDKVIINNGNDSFRKIAFGESYRKVKNEADIYKVLQGETTNFCVSHFSDEYEDPGNFYIFQMDPAKRKPASKKQTFEPVDMLVEFFQKSSGAKITLNDYLFKIQNTSTAKSAAKELEFLRILLEGLDTVKIPLGLVHRDFKPWNIMKTKPILIYDFEEAILDGLPLEDLFNYYTDPIIRYQKSEIVAEQILSETHITQYTSYLEKLNLNMDYSIFLMFYLVNRIIFWDSNNEEKTAGNYRRLFDFMKNNLAFSV